MHMEPIQQSALLRSARPARPDRSRPAWLARLVVVAILIGLSAAANGANYSWQVQSGDWSVASNWGATTLSNFDAAYIVNGGTAIVTATTPTCGSLALGGSGAGTVQMSGGKLVVNDAEYVGNSGIGGFTQSGGTDSIFLGNTGRLHLSYNTGAAGGYNLSGNGLLSSYYEYLGYSGTATLTQSGGTNSVAGTFATIYLAYAPGSRGTYNLSAGY